MATRPTAAMPPKIQGVIVDALDTVAVADAGAGVDTGTTEEETGVETVTGEEAAAASA